MKLNNRTIPVSVVIPCYRCATTIERAVLSVVNQTIKPSEIILVDDNSGDETLLKIYSLLKHYDPSWVTLISLSQNCGASNARNVGWEYSTCNYITFLDADDEWHVKKLEIQYSWMQAHPDVDLCGHNCVMLSDSSKKPLLNISNTFEVRYLTQARVLISNPFVTPSFMLKREVKFRFNPSIRFAEDFFLLQQLSLSGNTIVILNVELAFVYKNFGVTGVSGNLFKMRCGDVKNYFRLWQLGQLNFIVMVILIFYSIIKLFTVYFITPSAYEKLNSWIFKSQRRI